MNNLGWSESERKLSRRLFESALNGELAEVMADFKARAAAVAIPDDLWALEGYLAHHRREIDAKYDYRYSQLLFVFGRLVREGRLKEEQFEGLSADKRSFIQHFVSR